jgi:hypothetical protein
MNAISNIPRAVLRRALQGFGLRRPAAVANERQEETSPQDQRIFEQARPYTMTSNQRLQALLDAVAYVVKRGIPGGFVECGVWRGGSVLAMVLKLQQLGVIDRDIYLYDTFEGMTAPTQHDVSRFEQPALKTWGDSLRNKVRAWDSLFRDEVFNESMVRKLLLDTGYPAARIYFVKGPVEQTIPATIPEMTALLRLDTDWYESTRHELMHLYPRLQPGGVLIIDDYGHWEGCRRAVDEYFSTPGISPLLLQRIDYTGRLAVRA